MAIGTFEFPEIAYSFEAEFKEVTVVGDTSNTYILEDENGKQLIGVLVDERTIFNATPNDIRIGKIAATENGMITGEKVIPSYQTEEGIAIVPVGQPLLVKSPNCDYTKLQAIVCKFEKSLSDSNASEKVAINNKVYEVNSTIVISNLSKDMLNQSINFGLVNTSDKILLIRFFMYKEEY